MTNDKTKISVNRQKKEKIVTELAEKVAKAKAMVFANYEGMTHQQLESLKKALRKADAELVVAKNTLLKRSLEISNFNPPAGGSNFKFPTAALFAYSDVVSPLKELARVIKNLKLPARNALSKAMAGGPSIKFGIFDQKMLTAEDVIKLAALPSREVLLAQIVYGMKAPIYGLHRALSWNITKLVLTLKAVEKSKAS